MNIHDRRTNAFQVMTKKMRRKSTWIMCMRFDPVSHVNIYHLCVARSYAAFIQFGHFILVDFTIFNGN